MTIETNAKIHSVDDVMRELRTDPARRAIRSGGGLAFEQLVGRLSNRFALDREQLRRRLLAYRAGQGLDLGGLGLASSPTIGDGPRLAQPAVTPAAAVESAPSGLTELDAARAVAQRTHDDAMTAIGIADAAAARVRELERESERHEAPVQPSEHPEGTVSEQPSLPLEGGSNS